MRRGLRRRREPGGDEAGMGKIGAVIGSDFDLAGEVVFQHRLDLAIAVRPVGADEVEADPGDNNKGDRDDEEPAAFVARAKQRGSPP